MSTRFYAIVTGLCCSSLLFAQEPISLDMEAIEAHGTITAVTLYRSRAAITRTATLDLKPGGYSIFFRDLSVTTFLDTVQAHVSGNAQILSVDTSVMPVAKDNRKLLANVNAEIDEVESKLDTINSKKKANESQLKLLEKLIQQAGNEKSAPIDLEALAAQLDFVGEKMTALAQQQIDIENDKQELQDILQTLRQKKNNISRVGRTQTDAIVDIGVTSASTVTIEMTYLVNNADWQPTYSIRANEGGSEVTIEYNAEITQRTGEDWTDVALTLSTAQPQRSATPPKPRPWYVDIFVPADKKAGRRRSNIDADRVMSERKNESGVFVNSYMSPAGSAGLASMRDEVEMAAAVATVVGDGPSISFAIPRTITVPSNAQETQTTTIASIESSAELYRIAAPMITDTVFIQSKVTNDSPFILLPGQASIFHGSDYVGKAPLGLVAPNETFALNLGIDPNVTTTRSLIEKSTESTGLFSSGKQTAYDYRITISNGHDEPIDVQLWDRIPVSRHEDIEISLDKLSVPLSKDQMYLNTDRPRGLLRWDLAVGKNLSGEKSYVVHWHVEIARGKDVNMTRLPE